MKLKSCPSCGVVYDIDIRTEEEHTRLIDARLGYFISEMKLDCPCCNYTIVCREIGRTPHEKGGE